MAVNFKEFLTSAKNISYGNKEIDYRNATSRAYYAAYHEAKRVSSHSNHQAIPQNMGAHEKTIEKLTKHSGSTPKDDDIRLIGVLLRLCKKQRAKADYNIQSSYSKIENDTLILQVENLIKVSANLP